MEPDLFSKITAKVETARNRSSDRDKGINMVRHIRRGRIHDLFPDAFSDDMPQSIAANTIDTMARDHAELMSALPALSCFSGNMESEADKKRAMTRNKIGAYYWRESNLALQNIDFTDATNSYSFGVYVVEPDFDNQCPKIRWESSFGAYYGKNRYGDVTWYAKTREYSVQQLCSLYPEYSSQIKGDRFNPRTGPSENLTLITYCDRDWHVVYLPQRRNLVLLRYRNRLDRCPVVIAERPDQEDTPRGQYEDVVYPTLASAIMQMYMLKAADQAVNAPLDVPLGVTEIPFGSDAVIPNDSPKPIRRVGLDIPSEAFALTGQLDQNVKEGARYPEARTGSIKGNIVTGRGVEALLGTMDTQTRTMQLVIGLALEQVTSLCFEMDAKYWPKVRKTIHGVYSGKSYSLTYVPGKEIGDYYGCQVTYGFAAGLSPAQALVALLQLRGDKVISRDTFRLQLPFDIDIQQEQQAVDVEEMNEGLKQGFLATLQAMSVMVTQGQDPSTMLAGAAKAIQLREKGKTLSDAIAAAFVPPEPTEEEKALAEAEAAMAGQPGPEGMGADGTPAGLNSAGRILGVPPGQAGMAPGGMPAVSGLMAALRGSGPPRMEASIIRKRGIGSG